MGESRFLPRSPATPPGGLDKHATQTLHRYRVALHVQIMVHPENPDGGQATHEYCAPPMPQRIEGTTNLLRRKCGTPWDVESVIRRH